MSMMLVKTYLKFNVRLRLNNERLVGMGQGWTNTNYDQMMHVVTCQKT